MTKGIIVLGHSRSGRMRDGQFLPRIRRRTKSVAAGDERRSSSGANGANGVEARARPGRPVTWRAIPLAQRDPQTVFVPVLDWSFESPSADCNGWAVSGGADGIRAIPARTGDYSCKVCANGEGASLGLSQELGAVGKGRYSFSAYVRKRDTTAAPAQAFATVTALGAYGTKMQEVAPAVDVVETAWQRISGNIEFTEDAASVRISVVSADATPGDCLFVDDVVFTQSL